MRKSVIVLSVIATAVLATAGTAGAQPLPLPPPLPPAPAPAPAHGIAIALFGTTLDGVAVPVSQPLVDPALATCFDLMTPDGSPAEWGDFVNRTDRVAGVSTRSCADLGTETPDLQHALPPGASTTGQTWRSVRFTSIP